MHTVILPLFVVALTLFARPDPIFAKVDFVGVRSASQATQIEVVKKKNVVEPSLFFDKASDRYILVVPGTWWCSSNLTVTRLPAQQDSYATIGVRESDTRAQIRRIHLQELP